MGEDRDITKEASQTFSAALTELLQQATRMRKALFSDGEKIVHLIGDVRSANAMAALVYPEDATIIDCKGCTASDLLTGSAESPTPDTILGAIVQDRPVFLKNLDESKAGTLAGLLPLVSMLTGDCQEAHLPDSQGKDIAIKKSDLGPRFNLCVTSKFDPYEPPIASRRIKTVIHAECADGFDLRRFIAQLNADKLRP